MFNNLSDELKKALNEIHYDRPTKVQEIAIPPFLAGESVIVQAKTGSGKTASYLIPIIERQEQAIILAPTRELAEQVLYEGKRIAKYKGTSFGLVIGGVGYEKQEKEANNDIIIGTPGRLLDLWGKGILDLSRFSIAVVDEVDRMFDMGFIDDVRMILSHTNAKNFGFYSATVPKEVEDLAFDFAPKAKMLKVDEYKPVEIEHKFLLVRGWREKVEKIQEEIKGKAIVFVNTKAKVDDLARELSDDFDITTLHGDLPQSARNRNLTKFRRNEASVLISTDLAARGIDVIDVDEVINFDAPRDIETYIHRVGRTGRMGRKGFAVTFYTRREEQLIKRIKGVIKNVEYD
jgi:ATP-dependent RNA helicase DeaD